MQHSYLFETLEWSAAGTYNDDKGDSFPMVGETIVVRTGEVWTLGGWLEVLDDTPYRITNNYQINTTDNDKMLRWESENPAFGTLKGTFEIVGNSIISYYESVDGEYSGTEALIQLDDDVYHNIGVSFKRGKRLSSWETFLRSKLPVLE